jgi:hypothetical protein
VWFNYLPEMLLVCNEAAKRFAQKNAIKRKADADGVQSKPLGLEYIADRFDLYFHHLLPRALMASTGSILTIH